MKKVLLIGDSIRLSYMPLVADLMKGEVDVVGPEDNCRFVKYTLWCIKAWLDELGTPDLIHWNNGIWDVFRHNADMGIFTSLEDYLKDLARTLVEMRKVCPNIVWATTTPVDTRFANCENAEIDRYNAAAVAFMTSQGIPVHDLHAVVERDRTAYLAEDLLHLSEEGQRACAQSVVDTIRKHLAA